jgi:hypothetical protein
MKTIYLLSRTKWIRDQVPRVAQALPSTKKESISSANKIVCRWWTQDKITLWVPPTKTKTSSKTQHMASASSTKTKTKASRHFNSLRATNQRKVTERPTLQVSNRLIEIIIIIMRWANKLRIWMIQMETQAKIWPLIHQTVINIILSQESWVFSQVRTEEKLTNSIINLLIFHLSMKIKLV